MKEYIPLSGFTSGLMNNPGNYKPLIEIPDLSLLTDIDEGKVQIPAGLSDLTNEKTETIKLSVDAALKLQIPFGSADNKLARTIFIQEYKKYRALTKNEEMVHYGICIRWIVNIEKLNAMARISSLPLVAASGEFNYVNASARFEVIGISSPAITKLIPAPKDLTTETFTELNNAFNKIKDKIWDKDIQIMPKILGIYGSIADKGASVFDDSVVISYALRMISRGNNLGKAIMNIRDDSKRDLIKTVYLEIAGTTDPYAEINKESKDRASKYIKLIK